jgi:hypothetical protein
MLQKSVLEWADHVIQIEHDRIQNSSFRYGEMTMQMKM